MASVTSFCRQCNAQENDVAEVMAGNHKLRLCSRCHMVAYCSKACQRAHWVEHKPCCKAVVEFLKKEESLALRGEQRQLRTEQGVEGTSVDSERAKPEAERLAHEARTHKRACRYDLAFSLYNQAIELDPFNHWYYHHRGETWMLCVHHFKRSNTIYNLYLSLAIRDAQRTLDLEPLCHEAWLTMVRSALDQRDLEHAKKFVDVALQVVPDGSSAKQPLVGYKTTLEEMQMGMGIGLPNIVAVHDDNDDLFYIYTNGMHNHARTPELIAIDLDMSKGGETRGEEIIKWTVLKTMNGSVDLNLGHVYQIPSPPTWVLPIPVKAERIRKGILPLLGMAQAASNIVVLVVDYEKEPNTITEDQAECILKAIVENAKAVQSRYRRGLKLVSDTFLSC